METVHLKFCSTVIIVSSEILKGHSVTRYNPFCMEKGGV